MAAGLSVLERLDSEVYIELEKISSQIEIGIKNNILETGVDANIARVGSMMTLFFSGKERIENYSEARNFPNLVGTSKLSPYIKHGQIHVETIWQECAKIKKPRINKYLTEIGWREFNHSLINFFPHMTKGNYSKNSINFLGKKIRNF